MYLPLGNLTLKQFEFRHSLNEPDFVSLFPCYLRWGQSFSRKMYCGAEIQFIGPLSSLENSASLNKGSECTTLVLFAVYLTSLYYISQSKPVMLYTTYNHTMNNTSLHKIALKNTEQHYTLLQCTASQYYVVNCSSMHYTKLLLHFTAMHCPSSHAETFLADYPPACPSVFYQMHCSKVNCSTLEWTQTNLLLEIESIYLLQS